ncbi:hypothetical protein HYY69_07095 [Candidatus Woesearchaeota archaeon]|nr:hypothetical protein [Candidatus Woesearchaeota archaeon]
MNYKQAQSASAAAALVLIIGGFIIIYLLLLPPDYREALLENQPLPETSGYKALTPGQPGYGYGQGKLNTSILSLAPGRIDYLKTTEFDHPIPAISLYTTTNAVAIKQEQAVYVKNSAFDQQFKEIYFTISDLEHTESVLLSAQVTKSRGRLMLSLNDKTIFDGPVKNLQPIPLDKGLLKPENKLSISVSSVGWEFWASNEYQLQNLLVSGQYTDVAQQASKNSFTISDTEKYNLETVQLEFFPDCTELSVGKLDIFINNQNIYGSIPACTQMNVIEFSPEVLTPGSNIIVFGTQKGFYTLQQIKVHTRLKKQILPTQYFELPSQLFTFAFDKKDKGFYGPLCGEVDGICPNNCDEDLDKDCCFATGAKAWCDLVPDDESLRCRSVIKLEQCNDCKSGYEDELAKPVKECKSQCGDDSDGLCPAGCNRNYDKDCCFAEDKQNYWCNDVPKFGVESICMQSISQSQCEACPTGYQTKDPTGFVCVTDITNKVLQVPVLRPEYIIQIKFKFFDDQEKKAAKVFVNGHRFEINTFDDEYVRDISPFVVDGNNGIKIEPITTPLEIIKMDVEIKPR